MASQIYSRYIPPPKTPSVSNIPVSKTSTTATGHASPPTTPPTRQDASSTYARYVPPAKSKAGASLAPPVLGLTAVAPKRSLEEVGDEPVAKRTKKNREATKSRKPRSLAQEIPMENVSRTEALDAPPVPTRVSPELKHIQSLHLVLSSQGDEDIARRRMTRERKKGSKKADGLSAQESAPAVANNETDNLGKRISRKKERASGKVEDENDAMKLQGQEDGARHKKLMQKRENSMKKAERLIRKLNSDSAVVAIEVEKEDAPIEVHDLAPLPQPDPVPELPALSISTALPPWLATPIRVSQTATATFSDVGLHDDVSEILQKRGFQEVFAVQAVVLPLLLPGKSQKPGDVLVSAATGSGKTLAYVLPMVEAISRSQSRHLRGLIIMPTRELVTQAREVCEICASAFSNSPGRKRPKIGTAVGNETLKAEQNLLMSQELIYDPVKYGKQQARLDKKWENSEDGDDEEVLCDEEIISPLPDHVFKPVWNIDILICTPGRLVEHVKSTPGFTLGGIKWLVVDEADKLLDQSFQQWLEVVMAGLGESTKSRDRVRKIILSATMTRDIGLLNPLKLYRPKLVMLEGLSLAHESNIEVSQAHVLPPLLLESGVKVEDENIKPLYLMELLKRESMLSESPSDEDLFDDSGNESSSEHGSSASASSGHSEQEGTSKPEFDSPRGVLIFTKSNESAVRLRRLIALLSPSSSRQIGTLTSTTPRAARRSTLKSFSKGKIAILVASDLVSRGLDLPNLAHVINYDIPTSLTSYVHRIGRTARAGKRGHAWTLFTAIEGRWFWNEIGRTRAVERSGGKIERVNIKAAFFSKADRMRFEEALEKLGQEARNYRPDIMAG